MTEKLKLCPLCGGGAKTMPHSGVFCERWLLAAMLGKCYAKSCDFFRKEATAAWNRRANEEEER